MDHNPLSVGDVFPTEAVVMLKDVYPTKSQSPISRGCLSDLPNEIVVATSDFLLSQSPISRGCLSDPTPSRRRYEAG